MPALPPALGIAKITVKQTLAGVNVYNVLHAYMNNNAAVPQSELDSLASTVRAAWVTNVLPLQGGAVTLSDVQVVDLTNEFGLGSVASGSNVGTATGTNLPANACTCWSWKILNRYRGGHPRTYIAGLTSSNILNANTIAATHRTAHATAAAAVRTAINGVSANGGTALMCAVSYYKDKVLRPAGIALVFTGVSVDDRIDSQRRRLGRDR